MLNRADLWSLEQYSDERDAFRASVLAHKRNRGVNIGGHIQLIFEDELTIRYQIQEMLRIEKVFESSGIQEELDSYNPLIPDGDNWKCTMLIQYGDVDERKRRLGELKGIEDQVWVQIGDHAKVWPIADEDLERSNDEKTSAVHFLRYQFDADVVVAIKAGEQITFGVDHVAYPSDNVVLGEASAKSLARDLA